MTGQPKTLRCPLCGDVSFEHVDFHQQFSLDGRVNQLMGERCSNCGHVLLFLNMQAPRGLRFEEIAIRDRSKPDSLN